MIIKRLSGVQSGLKLWSVMTSKKLLTRPSRATTHAVSICMNTRASYFIMQIAPTCTAPVGGVIPKHMSLVRAYE